MAEKKETEAKKTKETKEVKEVKVIKEVSKVKEGHFVFIGKKGAMAYVLAVITQFGEGANEVIIKARGKSISRAVDVAEIVRNKSAEITLSEINISTEEVVTEDGRPLKISAIEIRLKK